MAVTVLMPKAGITVESCLIGAWNKKIGDQITVGDVLFSYETDKAVFDCESTADGTLLEIFFGDGDEVPVLTPVCSIGGENETSAAAQTPVAATQTDTQQPSKVPQTESVPKVEYAPHVEYAPQVDPVLSTSASINSANAIGMPGGRVKISPRAKNLAARLGISYSAVVPSGPGGRIIERDIERLASGEAPAATAPIQKDMSGASAPIQKDISEASAGTYTDIKLPRIRRVIADTMKKSLAEMAQLTNHHSFDATRLLALRARFKQNGREYGTDGVTVGDLLLYILSRTLVNYPDFNAHFLDGYTLRRYASVNLGVAVDTDRGLLVPTVFDAGKKTLKQLSSEVKALAQAARSGKINPDSLSGGTFTLTNLGALGVEMFTPIINPPQVAILGVCGLTPRVRAAQPGGAYPVGIEAYQAMGLSLTYDHRAVDGAPAAAFVKKLCEDLEKIDLPLSGE